MRGVPSGFWGKLEQDEAGLPVAWHSLVDHCLDVACVTEALLADTLLGRRLARLGGQTALDPAQVARLSVLGGLHDLGKFNHGFQDKAHPARRAAWRGTCAGVLNPCDDKDPCTADSCDNSYGCVYGPNEVTATCDDGDACTSNDACVRAEELVP